MNRSLIACVLVMLLAACSEPAQQALGTLEYDRITLPAPAAERIVEKVIERVENEGFRVGLVATIVDRQEGGAETLAARGYPLKAVFTREELIGKAGAP